MERQKQRIWESEGDRKISRDGKIWISIQT